MIVCPLGDDELTSRRDGAGSDGETVSEAVGEGAHLGGVYGDGGGSPHNRAAR